MDRPPTRRILAALAALYPDARCGLEFSNPFELLIATILSAQCTDERVNRITRRLFARYRSPNDLLALPETELAEEIKECGLHRAKARHIQGACRQLVERHGGQVPRRFQDLVALPGVGRKTANVVLANAFGVPALAVDTHVFRVSNRLGLTRAKTPDEAEDQLRQRIPSAEWIMTHHRLISHGRKVCTARRPRCESCPLAPHCRFAASRSNPANP